MRESNFISSYKSENNIEIEATIKKYFDHELPIYFFCSLEDFAPLMILECGWWGVPIICKKNSNSEEILSRFISHSFFVSIEIDEISSLCIGDLSAAA